jgi:hypothetical protein
LSDMRLDQPEWIGVKKYMYFGYRRADMKEAEGCRIERAT